MEGNLSSASTLQANNASYGGFDLQAPVNVHHHQQPLLSLNQSRTTHPTIYDFPLTIGIAQESKPTSDDEELSFIEESCDARNGASKGKKILQWHRVKWTDEMVRMLITAVSYTSEAEYTNGPRKKVPILHKKGKWKSISKVMAERGHFVSPQQCEDKFNDLNKRYKRLNEILGRGTSCEVVENPSLLDVMDHVSEKGKDEVRKILSSKHLHYEEMCSYHNGNRLHLPHDLELQCSLRLDLMSSDDHDGTDGVQREAELHCRDEIDANRAVDFSFAKRLKQCDSRDDFSFGNCLNFLDCNKSLSFENDGGDVNQVWPQGSRTNMLKKQWVDNRNHELEEKRIYIQAQTLELEKERFKWERFCRKKDRELEMMKLEIERMKLENERMALELRRKELDFDDD